MNDADSSTPDRSRGKTAAARQNLPEAFMEIRRSFQAREVLVMLEKHGPANDALCYAWLGKIGLGASHSDLTKLLDRLEADGFIETEQIERHRVITPRRAGIEIATARAQADWVARIDPD